MEADTLIAAVETFLRPLVTAAGGKLEVCGTPADTLEALGVGPKNFRVILQWGGETAVGAKKSEAEMDLKVVVQTAKGFKLNKGADVYLTRSEGQDNFIRICAALRGWVRSIKFVRADDITKFHPLVHLDGFLPQDTNWLAGGLDELAAVREAVLTFKIRFAITHQDSEGEAVPLPV